MPIGLEAIQPRDGRAVSGRAMTRTSCFSANMGPPTRKDRRTLRRVTASLGERAGADAALAAAT